MNIVIVNKHLFLPFIVCFFPPKIAILLKRLKKEKKARRRLAEQIGVESTTHVENGEVPSTPTEPVTKVNGDSQRLKNGRWNRDKGNIVFRQPVFP